MKRDIIVVTAAYGRECVEQQGGQQALLPIVAEAGADGVEIRRELFTAEALNHLAETGAAIAQARLKAVYSVPEALFTAQGELNPHIDRHLAEAQQLGAQRLKYALGHYPRDICRQQLQQHLSGQPVELLVENDQTDDGKLAALEGWFNDGGGAQNETGMTFDMGNWLWVGDDPLAAAARLSRFVRYIHVKAAVADKSGWRAIALDEADNLWRETLARLPGDVPRAIEFPLEGNDLVAITRHYVDLLREE
ncbi:sugar phosphate isomerase/epimerase [Erwinia sp. HDF1-3R]|uniref:sugar phosphate isomerase/epimerase family protein n=1 Tax=Erwinia sp. HDF1-3R TaxID=3141543 RepID=UPI0031F51238